MHPSHLILEACQSQWPASANDAGGLVVVERERVVALDAPARAQGVALGMRRAGVLALAPNVQIRDRDALREEALVLALAYALLQFTPAVVIEAESVVLMEVSASLRLFGGVHALRARVRALVASFGLTGAVSLATTGAAAWVLARGLRGGVALKGPALQRALARTPVVVAPPAREFSQWFEELGCFTLADLQRLPRAGLKKRCGTALLDWLDQVTGAAPVAYEWLAMPPTFDSRIELPDRVERADALMFAARRLILQMTGWLAAQQLDVAGFTLTLEHERGREAITPTQIDIALGAPTRFEEHLVRLVKERLANTTLVAPAIALRLHADRVQSAAAPSESLFPEPGGTPQDHARLIELLSARLGAENVIAPAPVADHRPEVAARWLPLRDAPRKVSPCFRCK
ncbi:DNA polymerase Y family protein [Pandoraea sp.]|uniref:Y-family DNA polymerase n=1 Tax=Pandoraea sp. TaxID=1883445 RepID=UPI0025DD228B|nr:DNA polymerase Y family protein [Pandoraea sp.]